MLRLVLGEGLGPGGERLRAALADAVLEVIVDAVGHEERRVFGPAVDLLGEFDFVGAEGFAVGTVGVLFVGRTVADVRLHEDEGWAVGVLLEGLQLGRELDRVVAVGDPLDGPAVSFETCRDVFGEGEAGVAVDGDAVVVVEQAEVVELEVSGERRGFGGNAFHHAAVAADGVDFVVEERLEARAAEVRGHPLLGDGHADGVADALAERAGGGFDSGGRFLLGVPRRAAAELPKEFELFERERRAIDGVAVFVAIADPGEVDECVEQHRGVAVREHEAIAVGPLRLRGVVAEELIPQRVGDGSEAHRRARMPRIRLLNRIHGEGANRIDASQIEVGHGRLAKRESRSI